LPLPRLRARGELEELRAAELRFTLDEAAAFLNEAQRLSLSETDIAALEARTEGWIAGLQLAALSIHGRDDRSAFIQAFAGDHRYIVDYLVDEVLSRQPQRVRGFLLQTAVLESLCAGLCDAVTGRDDSQQVLETLERNNLFVVPLDDTRGWFRYHHLFADVLRTRAVAELPDQLRALHRRASEWYGRNGFPSQAIRHALAADDVEQAANLLERTARTMLTGRRRELLHWLRQLPNEVIRARPVLGVYWALALLPEDLEAAAAGLRQTEESVHRASGPHGDDAELRSLPGTLAVGHAYVAGARGESNEIERHARRALDVLPADDLLWRGAAATLLGLAQWTSGNLEEAYQTFTQGAASLRASGGSNHEITAAFVLANLRTAQGRLREAAGIYERALELATSRGGVLPPNTADLYVGLSELCFERNDLNGAAENLRRGKALGEHAGLPENRYRWYVSMARIAEAEGDTERALDLLDEAQRRFVRSPDPDVRPVAAVRARLLIRLGRLTEARGWARERGLSSEDELSYVREFEHMTLARLLLARGSTAEALAFLERLLRAAEEAARTGSVIEILVLQALARADARRAVELLERALHLAKPEGYVRVFIEEGKPMRSLLGHTAGAGSTYARRVLAAFGESERLVERLSRRELEVLRLIAAGLRNQEIANQLDISLATVKRHIVNTYGKLGVNHRTEAIRRATELRLL
jgi:LuxR family maltose regulon positive regulatory protein